MLLEIRVFTNMWFWTGRFAIIGNFPLENWGQISKFWSRISFFLRNNILSDFVNKFYMIFVREIREYRAPTRNFEKPDILPTCRWCSNCMNWEGDGSLGAPLLRWTGRWEHNAKTTLNTPCLCINLGAVVEQYPSGLGMTFANGNVKWSLSQ